MRMFNLMDNEAFSFQNLTATINTIPEVPTLLGDLGIFSEEGIDTTIASIERQDETLSLVGTSPRGGAGEVRVLPGDATTVRFADQIVAQAGDSATAAGDDFRGGACGAVSRDDAAIQRDG